MVRRPTAGVLVRARVWAGVLVVIAVLAVTAVGAGTAAATAPAGAAAAGTVPGPRAVRALAGPTAGGAPAGGAAHPRGATGRSTSPTKAPSRSRLEQALARRQKALSSLTASLQRSTNLPAAERQTLQGQLSAESSGIDALASAVPGDPATQLATAGTAMVHQYRVFAVMAPKVRLAERAARQSAAESRAAGAEPHLAARIDAAAAAGVTVQAARQADADLVAKVATATAATQGAAIGALLAVSPTGYPGNGAPITTARDQLRSARSVLPTVRADLRTIRAGVMGSASGS